MKEYKIGHFEVKYEERVIISRSDAVSGKHVSSEVMDTSGLY